MLSPPMPNILHILLRVLAGIAGALLLYVAFFLYEDEEARMQNRLEEIWVRIDDLQGSAMSKELAFLQGVTRTTSAILDRLLGHRFLSLQSIAVSMAFSLASVFFWEAFFLYYVEVSTTSMDEIWPLFFGAALVVLGSLPSFPSLRLVIRKPYYIAVIIVIVCLSMVADGRTPNSCPDPCRHL
jgi:hypothetical protein